MRNILFCFLAISLFANIALAKSPFTVEAVDSTLPVAQNGDLFVDFFIYIPENHYIYADKTNIVFEDLKGLHLKKIVYPKAIIKKDPFFEKEMKIYEGDLSIRAHLKKNMGDRGREELGAIVQIQGCSAKLCYPPEKHYISWKIGEASSNVLGKNDKKGVLEWVSQNNFERVLKEGFWLALLVVFIGGILTSLTPCVLPIIPITLMIVGVGEKKRLRQNLLLSIILVSGIAVTYSGLGVAAVFFGKTLGFVFQQKWFLWFLVFFYLYLGLAMWGLAPFRLPNSWINRLSKVGGVGPRGAFLAGTTVGVLAAPCVGPVMGPLLVFIASTKSYLFGFNLLLVYALGMGILFIVLGVGYGEFQTKFSRAKISIWIKYFMGALLILGSLFYLNSIVPIKKTLTNWALPSPISWYASENAALAAAKKENKPIIIDFYADWCLPCIELDEKFFRNPEVVLLLKQMIPLRVDATISDELTNQLTEKYSVVGWPTILFLSPNGKVMPEYTVVSYNPTLLLKNLKEVLMKEDYQNSQRFQQF